MEIKLKKISGNAKEQKVGKIHTQVGAYVKTGDNLLEIEGNKGNQTIKSSIAGIIEAIEIKEGDMVKIGDVLLKIREEASVKELPNTINTAKPSYSNLIKSKKNLIECDIAILGGGPGGYVAAIQAAKMGAQVVVVEKDNVGGTCLNWGCIPTKALVRSAEVFATLTRASDFGLNAENISFDMQNILTRKDNIVRQLVVGIEHLLEKNRILLVRGTGQIIDKNKIRVKRENKETEITAMNIIIATGSETLSPPIPGANLPNIITSKEALDLAVLPKKLVIVGGGIIGMEFAFIYANFGVDVTVIEFLPDILPILDKDVCQEITRSAEDSGIKIHSNSSVEAIIPTENDEYILSFLKHDKKKYLTADKVLMAVGRKPCFDGIDTKVLGIEHDEKTKGIKVNEKMQTNIPNIYAIGDVTNIIQLAHVASHQGVVAAKNIMGELIDMDYNVVPSSIFTNPEIGLVGLGEKAAQEAGFDIKVGKFLFAGNGKALTLGEDQGFVKIVKDNETGRILGASIIGPHASDLIAELALAIKNGITVEQITRTIYAHPTTAEVIHEAALACTEGGALHFAE